MLNDYKNSATIAKKLIACATIVLDEIANEFTRKRLKAWPRDCLRVEETQGATVMEIIMPPWLVESLGENERTLQLTPVTSICAALEQRLDIRHSNWPGLLFFRPDYLPKANYAAHVLALVRTGDRVISAGVGHERFEKVYKVLRVFSNIKHKLASFVAVNCDVEYTEPFGLKAVCKVRVDSAIPSRLRALIHAHLEAAGLQEARGLEDAFVIVSVEPPAWEARGRMLFYIA